MINSAGPDEEACRPHDAAKVQKVPRDARSSGFAAETATGIMGGDRNRVRIVSKDGVEDWPDLSKTEVAERLAQRIAERMPIRS